MFKLFILDSLKYLWSLSTVEVWESFFIGKFSNFIKEQWVPISYKTIFKKNNFIRKSWPTATEVVGSSDCGFNTIKVSFREILVWKVPIFLATSVCKNGNRLFSWILLVNLMLGCFELRCQKNINMWWMFDKEKGDVNVSTIMDGIKLRRALFKPVLSKKTQEWRRKGLIPWLHRLFGCIYNHRM